MNFVCFFACPSTAANENNFFIEGEGTTAGCSGSRTMKD